MNHTELTPVTKEVFEAYLLNLYVTESFGGAHETYYFNENKECIAYMETSSWNSIITYKVKNPLHRTNPKDTLYFKKNNLNSLP